MFSLSAQLLAKPVAVGVRQHDVEDDELHLDYRTLMEHRSEIRTKRLVVTHMSADMLERLTKLEVEAASDGRVPEL